MLLKKIWIIILDNVSDASTDVWDLNDSFTLNCNSFHYSHTHKSSSILLQEHSIQSHIDITIYLKQSNNTQCFEDAIYKNSGKWQNNWTV